MNVILLEKIGKLGALGDTVAVKAGYGRNFLIPTGKAVPANKANVEAFEARRAELEAAAAEKLAAAQARADAIGDLTVTIAANAGEEGKLFGSIGTNESLLLLWLLVMPLIRLKCVYLKAHCAP